MNNVLWEIGISLVKNDVFVERTVKVRDRLLTIEFIGLLVFGLGIDVSKFPFLASHTGFPSINISKWVLFSVIVFLLLEFLGGAISDLGALFVRLQENAELESTRVMSMDSDAKAALYTAFYTRKWTNPWKVLGTLVMLTKCLIDVVIPIVLFIMDIILFIPLWKIV
jgi:hypothetical protein